MHADIWRSETQKEAINSLERNKHIQNKLVDMFNEAEAADYVDALHRLRMRCPAAAEEPLLAEALAQKVSDCWDAKHLLFEPWPGPPSLRKRCSI